uniref:Putative ficolin/ixoderin n=1 Tax=Ixodes ricinus TaxID=34613 RepID=A0A147BWK5_IXORI
MFVAFLFIPVVAGNVFMEDSIPNIPEITERQSVWTQDYTIFDPCNTNKPGNRSVSCSQLRRQGHNKTRVYEIYILGKPVNVTCDMDSDDGGWTVIQRQSEKENDTSFFDKELKDYKSGFGTAEGSFWIGLDNLHALMSFPNGPQALRIDLKRHDGRHEETYMVYNKFHVGSAKETYKLTIGEYDQPKSKGYDALSYHNGSEFTVKKYTSGKTDRDNCFRDTLTGGWWFTTCSEANLNGKKLPMVFPTKPRAFGILWKQIGNPKSREYTYDKVEMKIRDADFGFCMGYLKS